MPTPSRSTSARWRSEKRRLVPIIPMSHIAEQSGGALRRPRSLCRRRAALQALAGDQRKGAGPDHPDVATSLNNLAVLYDDQGRYADAEPLYKRSLAIREKALGPDHPDVATSLNNLAELYDDQGRYADAEPLYKRSLAIYEKGARSRSSRCRTHR